MDVKIEQTRNYDKFHILNCNRDIRKSRTLNAAMRDINLLMFCPIIVDENMNVIDGQHRLMVCKEEGLPVYYVVIPSGYCDTDRAMVMLNKNQKVWALSDYLNYWAQKRGGCFQEMLDFKEEHKLNMSVCCCVFSTIAKLGARHLRNGIEFTKNPHAEDIIAFVYSPEVRILSFNETRAFVYAVRAAFDIYTPKQLEKLKKKILAVPQCATSSQYLNVFNNLIG